MKKIELIVFFAKMWGTALMDAKEDEPIYEYLESYDSEKLTELLSSWAEEFIKVSSLSEMQKEMGEKEATEYDAYYFFGEKLEQLLDSRPDSKYPLLYGVAGDAMKTLFCAQDVAEFIMEQGKTKDVYVYTTNDMLLLSTFGIYLNKIADMEYREELLKILVPMQQNIAGSN